MRETIFSPCGMYRYTLWRQWDMFNDGYLMCCGLNPSVADAIQDDPTIRRCVDFAKRWGYGALCMTNLFAYRSTDPANLLRQQDPIGPDNDFHLTRVSCEAGMVLAAWGTHGTYQRRAHDVLAALVCPRPIMCLGTNKDGTPKHPLYVPKTQAPLPYLG